MQELFKPFKGYFKIECIDKNGNITDSYEDKNFIMKPARRTVAEMFSGLKNEGLNKLVLGTSGGTNTPYIPITEESGFNKDRTHIYSESIKTTNGAVLNLYKYELVNISNKIYRYIGENGNVIVDINSGLFEEWNDNYTYTFEIKEGLKTPDGSSNYASNTNNVCNIDLNPIENLDDTTVTFTFELGMSEGNNQHKASESGFGTMCSLFNEAGMYFNGRLFCSKCFTPKVKDDSTRIKIVWKIIF